MDAMRNRLNGWTSRAASSSARASATRRRCSTSARRVGKGKGPHDRHRARSPGGHDLDRQGHGQRAGGDGLGAGWTLLNAPDTYMDKIACGTRAIRPGSSIWTGAPRTTPGRWPRPRACRSAEITVCVLDRPRHADIIASLRSEGVRVYLITDGDVAGVINTADPETGVDLYIGQGGAPEGVLACAALKCVGGQFQGRLVFRNADERARAARWGINDLDRKYDLHEIVKADAIFAATGVTKGALLDGVKIDGGLVKTHTLVMNSSAPARARGPHEAAPL